MRRFGIIPIQPVGQGLRLLRCHRLERRDFQLIAFDSDVFEPVCRGFGRHFGEAPFQQSAALGKVLFGGCRRRDGQRSGLAHRGEQGGRNTELAGNKTKRQLRDRLARAQQAARVTESAELQRETELVGVAAAALYGGRDRAAPRVQCRISSVVRWQVRRSSTIELRDG